MIRTYVRMKSEFSSHPEKCLVETTKIWLTQQKFSFKYESIEILFELTKEILLFFFPCNSNKKILYRQQKNGFAN